MSKCLHFFIAQPDREVSFCTNLLGFIGPKILYRYYRKIIECRKVFQRHNKMAILDLFQTSGRRMMKSEQRSNSYGCKEAHRSYTFPGKILRTIFGAILHSKVSIYLIDYQTIKRKLQNFF